MALLTAMNRVNIPTQKLTVCIFLRNTDCEMAQYSNKVQQTLDYSQCIVAMVNELQKAKKLTARCTR